jgi:hypothetical protein
MEKFILAGVGTIEGFTQSTTSPQKIFTSTTLQESGLNTSVTAEDIRGGLSNPLLGRYFHDSLLESNITDALFDMSYIALNVGGEITVGGDSLVTESVTTSSANTITVTGTPVSFGNAGTVGWYTIEGENNWQAITFSGKNATVTSLPSGTNVCVRYNAHDNGLQQFTIPANVIPSEVHIIMTYPLFAASADVTSLSTSSQVGELIVDIPRFQFNGSVELSLTSSGAATSNLSGSALAVNDTVNCNDMGRYGTVKLKKFGGHWYDNLVAMAVDGASISLSVGGTQTLKVIGIYRDKGSTLTGVIDNSLLTFTSDTTSKATVGAHTGVVTGAGAGNAEIEIVATDKNTVKCYAEVTVTA